VRQAAAAIVVLCVACSSRLPHPPWTAQPTSALVEVPFPPPPARAEAVPAKPQDDAVWIDGEWTWRGRRWAWMPGRWVVTPAGTTFSPWTSVRRDDGVLFYAPGVWRTANGEVATAPKPLAVAGAGSGVVFEPGGDIERTGPTLNLERRRTRPDGGT
jgi:hypothetical protein